MNNSSVIVLMPVYNGEAYLKEAIESILNQTFKDFEFLIINDASTDQSLEIINKYLTDKRIKLINNEKNMGLVYSLNKGLDLANSKYIVRMDQDDIALPTRLEKQIEFMEKNPDVGVSGTWFEIFYMENTNTCLVQHPIEHRDIQINMLFECSIGHPTVCLNLPLFNKYNLRYDSQFENAEDYELWSRAINYFKFANIPEVLLKYRLHTTNISRSKEKEQKEKSDIIRKNQNNYLIETLDQKEKNLLISLEARLRNIENSLEARLRNIENSLILNRILRKLGLKK